MKNLIIFLLIAQCFFYQVTAQVRPYVIAADSMRFSNFAGTGTRFAIEGNVYFKNFAPSADSAFAAGPGGKLIRIAVSSGGGSYIETDPTVSSYIKTITAAFFAHGETAYGWGNHASAGYLTTSLAASTYQPIGSYLTSFTETDPTVSSYVKTITSSFFNDGETAFSWGNHASAGYVNALAAIGSTANANGATISGGTLNMQPASTSFGGILTTGTQSIAGNKTWTGRQAISSGTLTDQQRAVTITSTLPSGTVSANNIAIDFQTTSQTSTQNQHAFNSTLLPGATGSTTTSAGRFENLTAATGADIFDTANIYSNVGVYATSNGSTTVGQNVGNFGRALNGSLNIGQYGSAIYSKNSVPNVGVLGMALNRSSGGIQTGGYFGLGVAAPTFSNGALVADNGNTTYNIFTARDNGSTVFEMKDGGQGKLNNYTGSNFYGLLAHRLAVDASGNIIQDTTTVTGGGSGSGWGLTGNAGTNTATNFFGSTDNLPVFFRVNNTPVMSLDTALKGQLIIGNTPGITTVSKSNILVSDTSIYSGNEYRYGLTVVKTGIKIGGTASDGQLFAVQFEPRIGAANTGSWTSTYGMVGVRGSNNTQSGATGTLTWGRSISGVADYSGMTITNSARIYAENPFLHGSAAITNNYGVYIEAITGGTNNFGLYSASQNNQINSGTLTAAFSALKVIATQPTTGTTNSQFGVDYQITSAGSSNFTNSAASVDYLAGYTGVNNTIGYRVTNSAAGTGATVLSGNNRGVSAAAISTTTGTNVGTFSQSSGGNANIGIVSKATTLKNSATNGGGVFLGNNSGTSPIEFGVYAGLNTTDPTFVSAAALIDNSSEAVPIAIIRDNGTEKARFADGGNLLLNTTTDNSTLTVNGSFAPAYISKATSYTATVAEHTIEVTATGQTITLPTAVGISGREYVIKLTASGSAIVATTSSQTIDGSTTYSLSAQYKYVTVQSNNVNWLVIANN